MLSSLYQLFLTLLPVAFVHLLSYMRKRKISIIHFIWLYIFAVYIFLVFSVTGIGTVWDIAQRGGVADSLKLARINLIPFESSGSFTYIMNMIMTMPLGFLLALIWKEYRNPARAAAFGFLFSAAVELSQLFTNRLADINDLAMNTIGALAGCLIWLAAGRRIFKNNNVKREQCCFSYEPVILTVSMLGVNFLFYNWVWFV